MIEHDDYYCQVLDLTLSESERNDLFEIAHQNVYHAYQKEIDSTNDNNYYQEVKQLPNWFVEKAKRFLDIGHPVFLRNKGNVPWHTDDKRMCSITVPLTDSDTPTTFKYGQEHLAVGHKRFNESQELQLLHRGNSFLQNNQRYHSVRPNGEWRMFLQISFEQPYSEIRKIL
jgi:hypothetical protein|tara:strand:- start:3055 stop:3567 length:513 start_codon:yes stop_codon:yes gene_type:complete